MWQSPWWSAQQDSVWRIEGASKWRNHPLVTSLLLFLRRRRYRIVMTTGNQAALYYGLLCWLFRVRPKHVVIQLYLDERSGLVGLLHDPLMRLVLRRAYGVIVSSRGEIEEVEARFGVPSRRVRFVPYHTNVIKPELLPRPDGPIFAGGRNFRDYETLVEAARDLGHRMVIVCGADQLVDTPLPGHIEVFREVQYERYMELLRGASFVVVPLSTERVPSGQVAFLEAMGYGKPVVTTESIGTVDYIRPGIDGALYRLGDVEDLRARLEELLANPVHTLQMGIAAYEAVLERFTFERHVQAKYAALRELATQALEERRI